MPAGNVSLEWGAALPVLEASRAVVAGDVVQGEARVSLSGLPVGTRVFLRLRATVGGQEHVGGDFQAFLPAACGCAEGLRCVDGLCRACTPDCTGRCPGADDGCGGECVAGDCAGCCAGTACRTGLDGDLCGEGGAACIACGL
jgi:hypothetical protein